MSAVPANIDALLIKFDMSQEELGNAVGLTQSAVSGWMHGKTPSRRTIRKLCEVFDLTPDDILSEHGLAFREHGGYIKNKEWHNAPLHDSVFAGTSIKELPVNDMFGVPDELLCRYPNSFLMRVSDESMNRVLPLGSYALINPTHEILDGKVYAVCIDGQNATIKRIKSLNNGLQLLADSNDPTFRSIYFDFAETSKECIVIIGQVVWYCVPFDFEI